jgi:hypothetical protein
MDYDYIIEKPRQALCPLLIGASNYPTWKSKIEMVLVRERLWSIISGRRVKPESGAKALTDFEEDCERATATIFLYLSDTAEQHVRDLRDPIEVWNKLKESFSRVGFAARYNLWKQLFTVECEHGDKIEVYLNKVRKLVNTLKEGGAEVSDEIVVTVALQGLKKDYDTVISVVTCGKDRPTFESLRGLLLEEEARKSGREREHYPAYMAGERKPVECWHCGKPGHKKDRCFELHPELREGGPSTGPLATPGGGRGLSPVYKENEKASIATEHW